MSINGIESLGGGFMPLAPTRATPTPGLSGPSGPSGPSGTAAAGGTNFGDLVLDGLDRLEGVQKNADHLAVQAATGELANIHDYTIAATQAQVSTQVTVALRNKAVEAFSEIMRMQVG